MMPDHTEDDSYLGDSPWFLGFVCVISFVIIILCLIGLLFVINLGG